MTKHKNVRKSVPCWICDVCERIMAQNVAYCVRCGRRRNDECNEITFTIGVIVPPDP